MDSVQLSQDYTLEVKVDEDEINEFLGVEEGEIINICFTKHFKTCKESYINIFKNFFESFDKIEYLSLK